MGGISLEEAAKSLDNVKDCKVSSTHSLGGEA
jgi:hypothetical protein